MDRLKCSKCALPFLVNHLLCPHDDSSVLPDVIPQDRSRYNAGDQSKTNQPSQAISQNETTEPNVLEHANEKGCKEDKPDTDHRQAHYGLHIRSRHSPTKLQIPYYGRPFFSETRKIIFTKARIPATRVKNMTTTPQKSYKRE